MEKSVRTVRRQRYRGSRYNGSRYNAKFIPSITIGGGVANQKRRKPTMFAIVHKGAEAFAGVKGGHDALAEKDDKVMKTSKQGFRSTRTFVREMVPRVVQEDCCTPHDTTKQQDLESDCSSSNEMEAVERTADKTKPQTALKVKKRPRYILFIGSIPFEASKDDIISHFKSRGILIKDLRLLTRKETGKSRGVAFAEFSSSKDMQNALKLHHTKLGCKKINVEITCGGGGTSEKRQQKIRQRNSKLRKEKREH